MPLFFSTPGAAPRKIFRCPRPSFLARASNASGEALCASSVGIWLLYRAILRLQLVQCEIELEHIDPQLAQKAQGAPFDLTVDKGSNTLLGQISCLGNT